MDNAPPSFESTLTEDQQAVNEYFASEAYQEASRRRKGSPRRWYAASGWRDGLLDLDLTPSVSFVLGLAGLNVILVIFASLSPIAIYYTEDMVSRSNGFFMMLAYVQTIIFPPIISFSFATVTPMFWYGSVLLRFATGFLMVVPGCVAFYTLFLLIDNGAPDDFWFQLSGVMFTQFLVAGTVALVVQMWSPWTLTHQRDQQTPLPPLGTLAILELTGVAAIGCAVFMTEGMGEIWQGILFFAAMGAVSSLAVITVLIAFLREDRRNLISAVLALVASIAMASLTVWLLCRDGIWLGQASPTTSCISRGPRYWAQR